MSGGGANIRSQSVATSDSNGHQSTGASRALAAAAASSLQSPERPIIANC